MTVGVKGEGEAKGEVVGEGGEGVEGDGDGEGEEVEDPVGQTPTVVHWPSLPHFKNRGFQSRFCGNMVIAKYVLNLTELFLVTEPLSRVSDPQGRCRLLSCRL